MSGQNVDVFNVKVQKNKKQIACTIHLSPYRVTGFKNKEKKINLKRPLFDIHYFDLVSITSQDSLHLTFNCENHKYAIYSKKTNQIIPLISKRLYVLLALRPTEVFAQLQIAPPKRSQNLNKKLERIKKEIGNTFFFEPRTKKKEKREKNI
eukprot:Anaeramoba_flamelloidesa336936_8.p1 GENE.a336936_8~~a336936_8.p1  ORF type:complete len:151 (-),score=24.36 a336936_8:103-555(-)